MNGNDYKQIAEAYHVISEGLDTKGPFGNEGMFEAGKNKPKHKETDMANPEEKREVQIAKEILKYVEAIHTDENDVDSNAEEIFKLANELLKMHQKKPAQQFGSQQMKDVLDKHNPKPPTN